MNVLVYGISNQKGGISEFMMNTNKNLCQYDIKFNYIIKGKNSIYENIIMKMNGNVIYYNFKNNIERITELYKIIKKARKDTNIFYYNTSGTYFIFPILFAKILDYKIISHAHAGKDININKLYLILNIINRTILNKVSKIKLTCSDIAKEWVYGKNKKAIQINNAINPKKFFYNKELREKMRKKLEISNNQIVLINVGRVEYPKNQKFLINLIEKLNKTNKNYKLLLVGEGKDFKVLQKYIINQNIKNILFLGQRDDINELLNSADIFLLPSIYEGFPIGAVEAQATGLPCILSDKITRSSNIAGIVQFLPLEEDEWVNGITNIKNEKREDKNRILKEKGFDENIISKKIYLLIKKIAEEK